MNREAFGFGGASPGQAIDQAGRKVRQSVIRPGDNLGILHTES